MKAALPYLGFCASLFSCCFYIGCASAPKKETSENTKSEPTNLVVDVINIASTNTNVNSTIDTATKATLITTNLTNTIIESLAKPLNAESTNVDTSKIAPKEQAPKPWSIEYSTKENIALIDNVCVSLYKKPSQNKKGENFPHAIDQATTIDIILNAHTTPIATNRAFRVFIDPGHGGNDPGAIIKTKKIYEKTLSLDIAKRLQEHLSNAGFITKLSRTDNKTTLTLEERNIMATSWGADVFISIHINSSTSHIPNGYETYVLANVGQPSTSMNITQMTSEEWDFVNEKYRGNNNDTRNLLLGYAIHRKVVNNINIADRGLRRARFHVLREATMPAVLVECGYLSSSLDYKYISTTSYRENCARGIYQGIYDYAYGRMQPGLQATPIPPNEQTSIDTNPLTKPPLSTDTNAIQTQIWTPNYVEEDATLSPGLAETRAKALVDAGISFSPKDDNLPKPPQQKQPKD